MTRSAPERRASEAVVRWLRHHLEETRAAGVALIEVDSPEATLLRGWLGDTGIEVLDAPRGRTPLHTIGDLRVDRPELLPLSVRHKGRVLLDGPLPAWLPLGDLWSFELRSWGVPTTLPDLFADLEGWEEVEARLARALDGGEGLRPALAELGGETSAEVERRVRRASTASRPRIPKLSRWTLGVEPHLG